MADMTVRILLPADGRILTVDLDDTVTVKELINELSTSGHLTSSQSDYRLSKKVGELLANDVTIRDLGLTANDVLSLTSAPAAGDSPPPPVSGVPPPVSGVPAPQWRSAMAVPAVVIVLLLIGSALFLYEQQTYYAARGNAALLNSYLRNCIICMYKTEAVQEENSLQNLRQNAIKSKINSRLVLPRRTNQALPSNKHRNPFNSKFVITGAPQHPSQCHIIRREVRPG